MKNHTKQKDKNKFFNLVLSFVLTVFILNLVGLTIAYAKGLAIASIANTILLVFINTFWFCSLISVLVFSLYYLFGKIKPKLGYLIAKIIFLILLIIEVSLVKYYTIALVPLGVDLISYSLHDIIITTKSSLQFSFIFILPFIFYPLFFIGLNYLINKFIYINKPLKVYVASFLIITILKFSIPDASNQLYQDKLDFLITDIYNSKTNEPNYAIDTKRNDYPLLRSSLDIKDVLGNFFSIKNEKPNIVFIVVEGLGRDFVGNDAQYGGFTPFIDSLTAKSLYFKNFVSNAGRSFGALPSIFASLPYGKEGFLSIKNPPEHLSLISILKVNGYKTSFYTGINSSFDRDINFLENEGIDYVLDESKFGEGYKKTKANAGGFSWGYPDSELFRKTLTLMDTTAQPRLDIIFTISNHEPFVFPNKKIYLKKVDSLLKISKLSNVRKVVIKNNKKIFASLLYTDNSIKTFINAYKQRKDYKNTIFIITGDHRLIPIPQKDKLCRFHVPLIINSPLIKKPAQFASVSSQLDITPSLVSFLIDNYNFKPLAKVDWMSNGLDTARIFRNLQNIPFMRYKGSINDFMYKNYLLSGGKLFQINKNFGINKIYEPTLLEKAETALNNFKKLNYYLTTQSRILPDSLKLYSMPKVEFTKNQLKFIDSITKGLNYDQIFFRARELAFNKKRKESRVLCDYILNELPNDVDARILMGRTLAWDRYYKQSEHELLNAIKRNPDYSDAYNAIFDLYWWSSQDAKSIKLYKKAMINHIDNPTVSFKIAKAYNRLNDKKDAQILLDSLIRVYPKNKEYKKFKKNISL